MTLWVAYDPNIIQVDTQADLSLPWAHKRCWFKLLHVYSDLLLRFILFPDIFGLLAGAFCDNILPQCTFCMTPENLYNLGVSRSIDHIFYKGYKSLVSMCHCRFINIPSVIFF